MLLNKIITLWFITIIFQGFCYADTNYQGVLLNPEKTINAYKLIDQNGNNVTFPPKNGKYQLVFFGYTSCPDICPMALQKIKHVIKTLPDHQDMEFYFISIDSDRDSPDQMKAFLDYFHPDIKGLTGDIRTIKQVEKEFGILTRKFQGKSALAYKLEHSVFMYLLNKKGNLMLMYPGSTTSTQLVSDLNRLLTHKEM